MISRWGGYTIIEVMIVLAVSTGMFISVLSLMGGRQSSEQFSQSMYDLNSKVQSWVNDIANGVYTGANQYTCSLAGSPARPVLTAGVSAQGTNYQCIFLGRAMQVAVGQSQVYSYSVLSSRTKSIGGAAVPVASIADASPEPIFGGAVDLSEFYDLNNGTKVVSATPSTVVTFYNSLQDGYAGGTSTGGQSINMASLGRADSSAADFKSASLKSCIESTCTGVNIDEWDVCFKSADASRTAKLIVKSTSLGIVSNIDFGTCS